MSLPVLVLDRAYTPHRIVSWQHAVVLLLEDKARSVEDYAGRFVRSTSRAMPWPAVIALVGGVGRRRSIRFNRLNVLARDGYGCVYCGKRPQKNGRPWLAELTLDHVVPRARSKDHQVVLPDGRRVPVTCWENVVTCCIACNTKKADRTPAQVGLVLKRWPRAPTAFESVGIDLMRVRIPEEWKAWVPEQSATWRDYWTVELDQQ